MTDGKPPQPEGEQPRPTGPTPVPDDDRALWRQLGEATTAESFGHAWLGLQARAIGGVEGGLVALSPGEGAPPAIAAVWPRTRQPDRPLLELVNRAVRQRKGCVERRAAAPTGTGEPAVMLAFPIVRGRAVHGAVGFDLRARSQIELQSAMRQLQWGIAWLHSWVLGHSTTTQGRATTRLSTVLELSGLALEEEKFRSAALAVVTELAARLECDRVSIGFLAGKQVKVRAVSHSAQFGKQMNLIRSIGMAMGEAVDQQVTLAVPQPEAGGQHVLQAHEKLAQLHGDGAICTVPFVDGAGEAFGALTFERATAKPFDEVTTELCEAAAAVLGPILEEKRRNDRLLIVKAGDSLATQVKRLVGPRRVVRKLVALALVALTVFFVVAHGQYRVTAEATLEGEVRRVVSAPFAGFITEADVRGGDLVEAGQVMASLDVRDLRLEYTRWASEREQYAAEHRRAMAEGDRAAAGVLKKKMGQAEAQIELLGEQISRATIKAPFAGLVVSGDLSQTLGAPVKTGEVLFEVAPLDAYRVVLQVGEADIGDVRVGQLGTLVLSALPERRYPFTVRKVTPVSIAEEGTNFFRVEARLDGAGPRLRPGMQGYGKVDVDRRRLIWIWTHTMIDWIRIKLWVWLP